MYVRFWPRKMTLSYMYIKYYILIIHNIYAKNEHVQKQHTGMMSALHVCTFAIIFSLEMVIIQ